MVDLLHGRRRRPGHDRRLADAMRARPGRALLWLILATSFVFVAFPEIDLIVSAWYAAPAGGFPLSENPALLALRDLNRWATIILSVGAVGTVLLRVLRIPSYPLVPAHKALYFLSVLVVGPGLLVNSVLKPVFGRARPRDITEFGGTLNHSGLWEISGACIGNCSFSSGEAASATILLMLLMLVPRTMPRVRLLTGAALVLLVAAISYNRVVFGGHFLSDSLLSVWLTLLVMVGLQPFFFGPAAARIDAFVAVVLPRRARRIAQTLARLQILSHIRRAIEEIGKAATAWPIRATSRRSSSPIPAGSTPPSS